MLGAARRAKMMKEEEYGDGNRTFACSVGFCTVGKVFDLCE